MEKKANKNQRNLEAINSISELQISIVTQNIKDRMNKDQFSITIQVCSNCKQHQWCTRHNETTYASLAQDVAKSIRAKDSSINVEIIPVSGQKMGSFEIICNSTLLFSKLSLGYFPHVPSVTARIFGFIDDVKNGGDLTKYYENKASPVRSNSASYKKGGSGKNSPVKKIKYGQEYKRSSEVEENNQTFQKSQEPEFILQETQGQQSVPKQEKVSVKSSMEEKVQKQEKEKQETPKKEQKIETKQESPKKEVKEEKKEEKEEKEQVKQNQKQTTEEVKIQAKEDKKEQTERKQQKEETKRSEQKEQKEQKVLDNIETKQQKNQQNKEQDKKQQLKQDKKQEKAEEKKQQTKGKEEEKKEEPINSVSNMENEKQEEKNGKENQIETPVKHEEDKQQEKKEDKKQDKKQEKDEQENYENDFEVNESAIKEEKFKAESGQKKD